MTDTQLKKRISINARKYLGFKGCSIKKLSKDSGISYRALEKMFNGEVIPHASNLVAVCVCLECDPSELFKPLREELS